MKITASLVTELSSTWSSSTFDEPALRAYAAPLITDETRNGVALLSLMALLFLAMATAISAWFELGALYTYTYCLLSALAVHIRLSSAKVGQLRELYLLAALLLVACASSLVLLAQHSGQLDTMLLLSVAVLIMLVPVVPWGLREAALTTGAIYLVFTVSTFLGRDRFAALDLWTLQCLMLVAAAISMALVARALALRKHDLTLRFDLEQAKRDLTELADRDPLTGCWNRRRIERDFERTVTRHHQSGHACYFGLFDIDRFKSVNDTFGHDCGDAVLRAVHTAFGQLDDENDYLVRLGGDEFALLMCGADTPQRVEQALRTFALASGAPLPADGMPTLSMGLVHIPAPCAPSFGQAYRLADELLYQAKRDGGDALRQRVLPQVAA
jgi:diguanylate cyclase